MLQDLFIYDISLICINCMLFVMIKLQQTIQYSTAMQYYFVVKLFPSVGDHESAPDENELIYDSLYE